MPEGPQGQNAQSPAALRLAVPVLALVGVACALFHVKPLYMDAVLGSAFLLAFRNYYAQRS